MKKLYTAIIFLLIFSSYSKAQCVPGANYADSLFGAWPDTTINFIDAIQGMYYSADLNFKVPSDAGDIDPVFAGNTIVDFTVDSVVGLPAGLSYTCNVSSCNYSGGSNGCAQISGISNDVGQHNITIHITANLAFFGTVIPVPYTFNGYHINVGSLGLDKINEKEVVIFPNPVTNQLFLKFLSEQCSAVSIVDTRGKVMLENSEKFDVLDLSNFEKGIYFIRLDFQRKQQTVRFVKE